jgi:hypothetical protein
VKSGKLTLRREYKVNMPALPHIDNDTQKLIADWLVAIGTILLAIIAVFQDKIRLWIQRPKLSLLLGAHVKSPLRCSPTYSDDEGSIMVSAYFFRLIISNGGNFRAEEVEVFASELQQEQADGTFRKISSFPATNLRWAYSREAFFKAISPGMQRHCDVCVIVKPSERSRSFYWDNPDLKVGQDATLLGFQLLGKPFSKSYLFAPWKYRLLVHVAAANIKPVAATIEFNHSGKWFEQESEMFSQGLGLRII